MTSISKTNPWGILTVQTRPPQYENSPARCFNPKVPAYGQQSNYGIVIKIDNKATAHKNLFKFPEEPTQI